MVEFKVFMVKEYADNKLAELLGAEQPLFDLAIEDLEEISGKNGTYKELEIEISKKFSQFISRELNLDIYKNSGEDIYKGLMVLIWEQNELVLNKYLGLSKNASLSKIISECVSFVEKLNLTKTVFRMKDSKAKEMLKKNPPKNIMDLLGYKKVDDLLKNERLEEVYGALRFAEGDEWLETFNNQYRKLKPSDFTTSKIRLIKMPLKWAPLTKKFIEKKKHNVTHLKELGVVIVLETEDEGLRHGIVLKVLPLLIHYFFEIHLYSTFFELKAEILKAESFGRLLSETIIADPKTSVELGGEHIHWRVIQRYFGKLDDAKKHPEIFKPHLQPEDLHWDSAQNTLARVIPELSIWEDLDYVGTIKDNIPLSLNMMDVTLSFANKNRYKEHLYYHFRESLWNEIFSRYMGREELEHELLAKLNNSLVDPEKLKPKIRS